MGLDKNEMARAMKNDTAHIRPVHLGDLPALQQICRQTFFETFSHSCTEADMQAYLAKSFAEAQLASELHNPDSAFYFLETEGHVLGYLKLNFAQAQTELQDANAIEIERIYVLHDFQGQGVGQALYQHALHIAHSHHARYIWLGVWEHNHNALRFYEKNGFVPFDKHTFHLGSDAQTDIMMKLELLR